MFPTGHPGMSQVEEAKEAETNCEPKKTQEVKQASDLVGKTWKEMERHRRIWKVDWYTIRYTK